MRSIRVAAVILRDSAGRVLTVRKQHTALFMFPGGKPEPGDTFAAAAKREVHEELGIEVTGLRPFGTFIAPAANEPDAVVEAEVFSGVAGVAGLSGVPGASGLSELSGVSGRAEIAEVAWVDPRAPHVPLAPLLRDSVFPLLPAPPRAITVFCGSALGSSPAYANMATELGTFLADAGITLVYGGGKIGLMGTLADAHLAAGGHVHGVIPTGLADKELAHEGVGALEVVGSISERKGRMLELGDAFVVLPGGLGTLEELFEAWVSQILGTCPKPIALYGKDYWEPLLSLVGHMTAQGFIADHFTQSLIVADSPTDLLNQLRAWVPPRAKWC